ncbi:hypothetical protein Misp01_39250 [Microtetraspora sp. NBRC 13810]|uniref:hypothetical protein n=1 Tax=Microtetraspora sp. NBRC 13810 TaxID=3030990 RepID=UPI002556E68C|nr:hypothetical protein [Microtetraspora sp. NBRC 13810]GLW08795.1 hypothetical protein Misp01_39250 [Microtetraspora sp. NBRC 13810]
MDFWGTVLVVLRRWYVTIPAFALALAAAAAVYRSIPTTYVSHAVLVLTAPPSGGVESGNGEVPGTLVNPLLNFDEGLSTTASILIQSLSAPDVAVELGAVPGGPTTYEVTNGSSNLESLTSGPFVFVSSESRSPEGAREIVLRVMERARTELTERQKELDAPASTYIVVKETVAPTAPQAQRGSQMRAAAAAVAVGGVASLCAAFAADSFADARRARRRTRTPTPAPPPDAAGDERPAAWPASRR